MRQNHGTWLGCDISANFCPYTWRSIASDYGAETNALKSLLDTAAPDDLKRLSDYHHASAAANIRAQTDLGNVEQARRARDANDQQAGLLRSIELEAERRLASSGQAPPASPLAPASASKTSAALRSRTPSLPDSLRPLDPQAKAAIEKYLRDLTVAQQQPAPVRGLLPM